MSKRKPKPAPPDTPLEAEFRAFAHEWAQYIFAPERTDDAALDRAIAAGADPSEFSSALKLAALRRLAPTRRAAVRNRIGARFAGHHQHYRDKYIIGLCFAAEGAGISQGKARRIVADVFTELGHKLSHHTVRKIDRMRSGAKGDPPNTG